MICRSIRQKFTFLMGVVLFVSACHVSAQTGAYPIVGVTQEPSPAIESSIPNAPRPELLLAKMSSALQGLNYSGEFTYEHGRQLESYRIIHQVMNGERYESLERLTGLESSVVRVGDARCGTIGGHLLAGARLTSTDGSYYGLDRYYHSSVIGKDRIAGKVVWVVQLVPRDEHRFGVALSIDAASGMLLRQVVFDFVKKSAIERMQFAALATGADAHVIDESTAVRVSSQRCVGETYSVTGHSPWKPTWLPPGFILTGYSHSNATGHMETYTDGVSSFSVFVLALTQGVGEDVGIQQGALSRGATMALVSKREQGGISQQVTVVGEIPLSTAQKVSLSVREITLSGDLDEVTSETSRLGSADEPTTNTP